MKKLIFIESSDIGVKYSADAARALGYDPVFLCDVKSYHADPLLQLKQEKYIACDTSQLNSLLDACAEIAPTEIAGVMSLSDSRLVLARKLADRLKVAGLDPQVVLLKDKVAVSELIPEYSPAFEVFSSEKPPLSKLKNLFSHSGKVILKPVDGAGGWGILFLDRAEELDLIQAHFEKFPTKSKWIAQVKVPGGVVSLEGFVEKGRISLLGFTDRKKIGATETGAKFPVDESIPESLRARCEAAVEALIQRSKFMNGYFHIEFIMDAVSATVIDANMGRVGGGAVAQQIALSYGIQPVQVYEHILALSLQLKRVTNPYTARGKKETYAILYGIEQASTVLRIERPKNFSGYHTQIVGDGSWVNALGADDWSWVGILSGYTDEVKESIGQIKVVTPKGNFSAKY